MPSILLRIAFLVLADAACWRRRGNNISCLLSGHTIAINLAMLQRYIEVHTQSILDFALHVSHVYR